MKEAVTKVVDTLTPEDFHGAFQKLLERYKYIAAGGDYFEGDQSFMCVLLIKVPIWKCLETYLMIPVFIFPQENSERRLRRERGETIHRTIRECSKLALKKFTTKHTLVGKWSNMNCAREWNFTIFPNDICMN